METRGRGACAQSVCRERERVEGREWGQGGEGGLSSPAYRSTKDNLTLPLGLLPRLPTWHSFYFCTSSSLTVNLSLCLSLIWKYEQKSPQKQTSTHTKAHTLLPLCSLNASWTFTSICILSLWNSADAYCVGVESFIAEGSCLGVSDFLKNPHAQGGPAAYRHQPPHKVVCMGIFILGAQLWRVELSGPQDLQYPIQGLCHRHRAAFLGCINDVDYLDDECRKGNNKNNGNISGTGIKYKGSSHWIREDRMIQASHL